MPRIELSDEPGQIHVILNGGELLALYERVIGFPDMWSAAMANEIRHVVGELLSSAPEGGLSDPSEASAPEGASQGGDVATVHRIKDQDLPAQVIASAHGNGIETIEEWAEMSAAARIDAVHMDDRDPLDRMARSLGLQK